MKIARVEKLLANLCDKTEYTIHIRNLKHALALKKVYRIIKLNEKLG